MISADSSNEDEMNEDDSNNVTVTGKTVDTAQTPSNENEIDELL